MNKIRFGIVGAGANTRLRHIPGFQELDGVEVSVVCNRSEASSRSAAEAFGIKRTATRWQDVVADPEIDAVCIGTWPYLHAPITIAALEAGKHVLTEARMAMDAREAQAMLEASSKRPDLVAQIVPSPFTLKWDETIAEILANGELGSLREISFSKSLPLNVDSAAAMNWRQDKRLSGNNTLMLGIYYEVVQRWLGREPARVLAAGSVFTKSRIVGEGEGSASVEIPETIDVIAEYADGLRLVGRMTGLELGAGTDCFVVAGSEGTLRLDLAEGVLSMTRQGEPKRRLEPEPEKAGFWRVEADFVESIRYGKPAKLTSFEDGVAYMKFTDAALKSYAADSSWVDL